MIKEELRRVPCGMCNTPLVIKRVDIGSRFKFELLCPYCGYYKAWFEEKKVEKKRKGRAS
jgi:RNase P subunit RPR2